MYSFGIQRTKVQDMIETGIQLAAAAKKAALEYKTLYVLGCFGAPMNDGNKDRYTKNLPYNGRNDRKQKILSASRDTFGFDCVCFVKGLLWGWEADADHSYGGAEYQSRGVPDKNADSVMKLCLDASTDFTKLQVGEYLWIPGHCGIYIGDGLAVESTPAWKNCVQITAVHNIGKKSGYKGRKWTKHGKLPFVSYDASETPAASENSEVSGLPLLERGSEGDSVKALQILLIGYGYSCGSYGVDGEFGSATENAVEAFQEDMELEADGKVGVNTWSKLLGV